MLLSFPVLARTGSGKLGSLPSFRCFVEDIRRNDDPKGRKRKANRKSMGRPEARPYMFGVGVATEHYANRGPSVFM